MPNALVYVDHSKVREGAFDRLKPAIEELVGFIDANEPQLLAYGVYLSDDGTEMTVVHIHADPESLDFHMEVAGPEFRKFADLVTMSSIEVYGAPSEKGAGGASRQGKDARGQAGDREGPGDRLQPLALALVDTAVRPARRRAASSARPPRGPSEALRRR